MVAGLSGIGIFFIVAAVMVLFSAVRVVNEYERGVIFRLGRLVGARGPGIFIVIPMLEQMRKVDLRTLTMDVPSQDVITRDNVSVKVNAVCYFRVIDPNKAINEIQNFTMATFQIAQTSMRSVVGQAELDELLGEREKINTKLQQIIDSQTEPWGIKVSIVEVKDVALPENMQRAIAQQAEAERERRARIINAEGEFQAAQKLAEAAEVMSKNPIAIQLRYLQTAKEIATERNTTTFFPLPLDFLNMLIKK
jgi:regulator of protease activity HflC (stomatin/prohibitin superfamily)